MAHTGHSSDDDSTCDYYYSAEEEEEGDATPSSRRDSCSGVGSVSSSGSALSTAATTIQRRWQSAAPHCRIHKLQLPDGVARAYLAGLARAAIYFDHNGRLTYTCDACGERRTANPKAVHKLAWLHQRVVTTCLVCLQKRPPPPPPSPPPLPPLPAPAEETAIRLRLNGRFALAICARCFGIAAFTRGLLLSDRPPPLCPRCHHHHGPPPAKLDFHEERVARLLARHADEPGVQRLVRLSTRLCTVARFRRIAVRAAMQRRMAAWLAAAVWRWWCRRCCDGRRRRRTQRLWRVAKAVVLHMCVRLRLLTLRARRRQQQQQHPPPPPRNMEFVPSSVLQATQLQMLAEVRQLRAQVAQLGTLACASAQREHAMLCELAQLRRAVQWPKLGTANGGR